MAGLLSPSPNAGFSCPSGRSSYTDADLCSIATCGYHMCDKGEMPNIKATTVTTEGVLVVPNTKNKKRGGKKKDKRPSTKPPDDSLHHPYQNPNLSDLKKLIHRYTPIPVIHAHSPPGQYPRHGGPRLPSKQCFRTLACEQQNPTQTAARPPP